MEGLPSWYRRAGKSGAEELDGGSGSDLPAFATIVSRVGAHLKGRLAGTTTESPGPISRSTLAGDPTATTPAGRSRVTTAPAPTTVFSPIVTPGHTIAPPPSQTLSAIVIGSAASQPSRRGSGSIGCVAVRSCTRVASWHAAPILIGATSSITQS